MQTFGSFGNARLEALCRAIDFDPAPALAAFGALIAPWSDRPLGATPPWPSDITDDHTPYELSVGIEGERAEPRFLVESQGDDGTLATRWAAGRATNERLRRTYGVALERFERVADLFEPRASEARFALWHAGWLRHDKPPVFKVYLNPQVHGPMAAPGLVREALGRLGFAHAWSVLAAQLARRPGRDRLIYFSLDLDDGPRARVKVYVAHGHATADDVEPAMTLSAGHVAGDAAEFCRAMTGGEGPFSARPLLTCLAFTAGSDARPTSVTLHLPIRCYVADDGAALVRITAALAPGHRAIYRRAVAAVAARPLSAGVGLQTYASFRRQDGRPRTTAYLALEAFAVAPANRTRGSVERPVASRTVALARR